MAPIKADLQRIAAIKDKSELARAIGGAVRADVDPLNATDMATENLFGVFVTQALAQREDMPYLMQGGLGMPEREYYLSTAPDMARRTRPPIANISATCWPRRALPIAKAKAAADLGPGAQDRRAHATREESEDWSQGHTGLEPGRLREEGAGHRLEALLRGGAAGQQPKFDAFMPARSRASPRWSDRSRWTHGRTGWRSTRSTRRPRCCPSQVRPAQLRLQRHGTARRRTAAAARQAAPNAAVNGNIGDAVGKLYVAKYFPASDKTEIQDMVDQDQGRVRQRIEALTWMAPATKAEAGRRSRRWPSASAIPTTGATIRR